MSEFFEPGRYYVGDLKPVLGNLIEAIESLPHNNDSITGNLPCGIKVNISYTWLGNGVFLDDNDCEYIVRNYHIGIVNINDIPLELIKNITHGRVIDFDQSFQVKSSNGLISIGDINIETNSENDEYLIAKLACENDLYAASVDSPTISIISVDLDESCFWGVNDDTQEEVAIRYDEIDLNTAEFYRIEKIW